MAACGSGDDGLADADDPLVQSIAVAMSEDEGDMLLGDPADSECFAQRIVGDLGPDRLAELGITVDKHIGIYAMTEALVTGSQNILDRYKSEGFAESFWDNEGKKRYYLNARGIIKVCSLFT